MRAMILAAGRGKRMGELTQHTPKPLLKVRKNYLIEHAIFSLLKVNIKEIVINISYHAEQIKMALGDGSRYGAQFYYSEEVEALETGGGIFQALPLLGNEPFIVISADIITDYPLAKLMTRPLTSLAHLVLVDNPFFHPNGDFSLQGEKIYCEKPNQFTFANIGLYDPQLFAGCKPGRFPLRPIFDKALEKSALTGEHYRGIWHNVGTPDDLLIINHPCYSL